MALPYQINLLPVSPATCSIPDLDDLGISPVAAPLSVPFPYPQESLRMASPTIYLEEDYKTELAAFGLRLKARRDAERYAPWHPKNLIAHPRRSWRMAFGAITDAEWEGILAHMDDKGTGNGSKKGK